MRAIAAAPVEIVLALLALGAGANLARGATPVAASAADDAQWLMPAKDYAATRYSRLADITARNATTLHPVWTFSTGVLAGHEGHPLVVGDTMYVITPWPNVLYAFDLSKDGYPMRWKYRQDVSANAIGVSCCDTVNRGAFYADGKIIYNLLDGHTVAVDAESGQEVWKTQIADMGSGETVTMAPLVVKDRVIVGASGGEFGIYGWTKGLDLKTGAVLWTAHNLGPDADMLRGADFKTPYDSGADLGVHSWPGDTWRTGGAPVWGWLSYDPELDLIYYGTGNAGPYNAEQRPGDNKWTASVLARRPADGSLVWAYQFTPHDSWDFDATGAMVLADLTVAGKPVKALVHFDKNGFAYTLDRTNGRVILAQPFVKVNWATAVDLQTGRPVVDPAKQTGASKGTVKDICPCREPGVSACILPAHAPLLYLHQQPVHGLRLGARRLSQGHALHGHQQPLQCRPRRLPRHVHGLGRRDRQEGLGEQGGIPQLERRARDGRGCRLLRHPRRLVQVRRCPHRQGAFEVQGRLGRGRQPHHLPRPGRQAIRGGVRRHRRGLAAARRRCALG